MRRSTRSWRYFDGVRKKALAPLTPEQERIRYRLWERWAEEGRALTLGRWNMAAACARNLTSYVRDTKWSRRLRAYKGAAAARRKYADPVTGKVPFANGFFDAKKAANMSKEVVKARKEQKVREETGGKLRHSIPGKP